MSSILAPVGGWSAQRVRWYGRHREEDARVTDRTFDGQKASILVRE